MAYCGNYSSLVMHLNYDRVCIKKVYGDKLTQLKQSFGLKNLDIKHGSLVSTVFHNMETVRRHQDFNLRCSELFRQYANHIVQQYRSILNAPDRHARNPLHYCAMSKFTTCYKLMQALLTINIDHAPDYEEFLQLYF